MAHFLDMEAEHSGPESDDGASMQLEAENVNPNRTESPRAADGEHEGSVQFLSLQQSPSIASRQASATPSDLGAGKRPRGRPRGSGVKGKPPLGVKRPVGRPRKIPIETTPIPGADSGNIEDHPGAHHLRSPHEFCYDEVHRRYRVTKRTLNGLMEIPEPWGEIGPIQPNEDGILEFDENDRERMAAATKAHPGPCTHTPHSLALVRLQDS